MSRARRAVVGYLRFIMGWNASWWCYWMTPAFMPQGEKTGATIVENVRMDNKENGVGNT